MAVKKKKKGMDRKSGHWTGLLREDVKTNLGVGGGCGGLSFQLKMTLMESYKHLLHYSRL